MRNSSIDQKYPGRSVRREGDQIVVTIPVKFYRRNGRQMIKTQNEIESEHSDDQPDVNETLATVIAKAYAWQEELESGEYSTIEELADAKRIGRTYAGRIMRLTSLSPQIVESILNGQESPGLSLRQLHKGIPDLWGEQMEMIRR